MDAQVLALKQLLDVAREAPALSTHFEKRRRQEEAEWFRQQTLPVRLAIGYILTHPETHPYDDPMQVSLAINKPLNDPQWPNHTTATVYCEICFDRLDTHLKGQDAITVYTYRHPDANFRIARHFPREA